MKNNKTVWLVIIISLAMLLCICGIVMMIPYICKNITIPWINTVCSILKIESFAVGWTVAVILDILTIPFIILIALIVRYSIKRSLKNK